jgi:type IV secretion system protein VirB1
MIAALIGAVHLMAFVPQPQGTPSTWQPPAQGRVVDVTLRELVSLCAPKVAPRTALAIIKVESGGYPWSIDDDTTHHAYFPKTYVDAVAVVHQLLDEGHNLDAGLMQVNSSNWSTYALTPENVFDPCLNVNIGALILHRAYEAALNANYTGTAALWHAFSIYNSGKANGSPAYANAVWAAGLSL